MLGCSWVQGDFCQRVSTSTYLGPTRTFDTMSDSHSRIAGATGSHVAVYSAI